jgi:phosphoribosylglycinamide formyltransferase-1
MNKANVAVFVSGRGSNAESLLAQQNQYSYHIALLLVSKTDAPAIALAQKHELPFAVLNKDEFSNGRSLLDLLNIHKIAFLCLAGFLWKIPNYLIQAYPSRIVNIHPSLLPKFGGKGMYGLNVHQAVVAAKESHSGITIHLVNEKYDEGKILFQEKIKLLENESPSSLSTRILKLEHQFYPSVLDRLCSAKNNP